MAQYDYTKSGVDTALLIAEINANETITQSVDYINFFAPESLEIYFASVLSGAEETELTSVVTAHDSANGGFYKANHCEEEQIPGNKTSEKWYQDCDGSNVVSNLAKELVITWNAKGKRKLSTTTKIYFKGGTLASEETVEHKYDRSNRKALHKKVT